MLGLKIRIYSMPLEVEASEEEEKVTSTKKIWNRSSRICLEEDSLTRKEEREEDLRRRTKGTKTLQ